ncbi:hypothetical protein CWI39_3517p0010 [Hamiltosporidium magnivora]|uniref:Uncharacterized protein n=1 Tax=Hamiltosporidium magnivora TaxID=148818 RepID=A0A4Q9KQK2_9MICR|nr:hypothetical protein CWI39_3517p0010 [Hamiltosporidium magnivora]
MINRKEENYRKEIRKINNYSNNDQITEYYADEYNAVPYPIIIENNDSEYEVFFDSLDDVIKTYKSMVKKTVMFEYKYANCNRKLFEELYPLLEEAKRILYLYYKRYLIHKIDISSDMYIEEFIASFEN